LSAFKAYKAYVLVKAHFAGGYDYFKYQGKSPSVKVSAFERRSDAYRFEKISDHIGHPASFFACNLAYDPKGWVGDMNCLDNEPYRLFVEFINAPRQILSADLALLKKPSLMDNLLSMDGDTPAIASALRGGRISLETAAMLCAHLNFIDSWKDSKNPADHTLMKKISRYSPFVAVNVAPAILMAAIKENFPNNGRRIPENP
jgi:hypothetical protein